MDNPEDPLESYRRALEEALLSKPPAPGSYDGPPSTDDEVAHYRSVFGDWVNTLPSPPDPYWNDRR